MSQLGNPNKWACTYFGQLQFWHIHENGKDLQHEPFLRGMLSLLYYNLFGFLSINSLRLKGFYFMWVTTVTIVCLFTRRVPSQLLQMWELPVWDDRDFPLGGLLWANVSVGMPQILTSRVWLGCVIQPDLCKPRELILKSWRLKWDWS